jgi:hypothetical protein
MTMTSAGFGGMSLDEGDMFGLIGLVSLELVLLVSSRGNEAKAAVEETRRTATRMRWRGLGGMRSMSSRDVV